MSKMVVSSLPRRKQWEQTPDFTSTCLPQETSIWPNPFHPYLHSMALVVSETYQNSHLTPGAAGGKGLCDTQPAAGCVYAALVGEFGKIWPNEQWQQQTDEDIQYTGFTHSKISGYIPNNTKHTTYHEIVKALVCFAVHHSMKFHHHQGSGSLRPAGFLHMEKNQVVYPCDMSKIKNLFGGNMVVTNTLRRTST